MREVIPIPELHTMMGCVNSGFNKLKTFMTKAGTMDQYLDWCKSSSITLHGNCNTDTDRQTRKDSSKDIQNDR